MKKLLLVIPLLFVGCVGLRMDQSKGTASYYRLGGQDIQDLYAKKQEADGGLLEVSLGRAQVGEPDILNPGEWSDIIADYLGAGLAKDAMGELQIVKEILGDKGVDLDIDDIKQKIAEKLNGNSSSAGNNSGVDQSGSDNNSGIDSGLDEAPTVTPNWPWDDSRYHVYKENNSADNNRGLWKPNSESRPGKPVLLLPAYMSRVGVKQLMIGGKDITNDVRKYPTDLLPILGNGRRLHYNAPAVSGSTDVIATLMDGSEYLATIKNGTQRQDPIGFKQVREADVVIDEPITDSDGGIPGSAEEALEELEKQDQQDIDDMMQDVEDALEGVL